MTDMIPIALVVPCHDEAARLHKAAWIALVDRDPTLALVFVDDGSQDGTAALHADMVAQRPGRIDALRLPHHRGKAEAVRLGLRQALQGSAGIVGYIDADLATPVTEIERLCAVIRTRPSCEILLGSRVRLMGRSIDRDPLRHYLGRAFATAASLVLRLPIYDTQCGAKLFRRTATLQHALAQPFRSRWVFDVELLSRLLVGAPGLPGITVEHIHEEPLECWIDSKVLTLRADQMLVSLLDLARIQITLATRRLRQG
jgi:dolichyl-phosphate beta-glucosyltransferase